MRRERLGVERKRRVNLYCRCIGDILREKLRKWAEIALQKKDLGKFAVSRFFSGKCVGGWTTEPDKGTSVHGLDR